MAAYNNLALGTQKFYLAQIDQTAAGKTLEIDLFDPGDVSGGAWLRVLRPGRQRLQSGVVHVHGRRQCLVGPHQRLAVTCIQAERRQHEWPHPAGRLSQR